MEIGKLLLINEKEVQTLLTPQKVLNLVESSLKDFANGESINPSKLHLPMYPVYDGYINSMPSYIKNLNVSGIKLVSVYHSNKIKHGIPTTIGVIVLFNPETGVPFSIIDGTYITAMPTGAVVGITAKYLARKNSKVLTIIGAGAQGFTSFIMTAHSMEHIKEVRVVDINPEAKKTFINKASKQFPKIEYNEENDIQTACTGADIIVSATTAKESVLLNTTLNQGTTVIGVSERLTSEFIGKFDKFIVDFAECLMERHNQQGRYAAQIEGKTYTDMPVSLVDGEIGDIIIGKIVGRLNDSETILFSSIGMSVEDISVAYDVYNSAIKKGLGLKAELFNT